MLFSLAWSAKLCPTYQVIITLHNSPSSMAKDTSLLETATPWHSADVFTWYFWRQSDAHFRLRAIASHDTEKRDDDADWYRYVYWMLLIYHPIPVSHIYIYCVQLGYLQSCEHLHHFGCKIASFFLYRIHGGYGLKPAIRTYQDHEKYPGLFGSMYPSSYPFHSSVLPLCWVSELDG